MLLPLPPEYQRHDVAAAAAALQREWATHSAPVQHGMVTHSTAAFTQHWIGHMDSHSARPRLRGCAPAAVTMRPDDTLSQPLTSTLNPLPAGFKQSSFLRSAFSSWIQKSSPLPFYYKHWSSIGNMCTCHELPMPADLTTAPVGHIATLTVQMERTRARNRTGPCRSSRFVSLKNESPKK